MVSQLLPIWYENMPEETSFLVPMLNFSWKYISYLLLALVYAWPVLLLLNRWLKENIFYMRLVAFLILTGLWIERWWLVSAVLKPENIRFGWTELIPTLVFAITMAVGVLLSLKSLSSYSVSTVSGYE